MAKSKSFLKNRKLIIILILVVVGVYLYLNYVHDDKVTRIEIQDNYTNNGSKKSSNNSNNANNEERELRKELLKAQIEATKVQTQRDISSAVSNKSFERVVNPLLPPERSYEAVYGVPINIPTRGVTGGYQQVGYLYKEDISNEDRKPGNNTDTAIIPLYGQRLNGDKWNYYVSSDKYHSIKMPIMYKNRKCDSEFGCNEIYDDDEIDVPAYNGKFKVNIYQFDKPRYLPNII